jgi:ABC-2 type transport system permease protein
VSADLAIAARSRSRAPGVFLALVLAGFRRYSTYRQATAASTFTNCVFGFMRTYVLLAALATAGSAAGYDRGQLVLYCWASQGVLGVVLLWGWTELGDRIRTGDVVSDLLRPVAPVQYYLAVDLGRAGYALLNRFVVPMIVGIVFFHPHLPVRPATYPLFAVSVLLGVIVSFGIRFLVNAAGYWLLDIRGVILVHTFATALLTGLSVPVHFFPTWLVWLLWVGTPFPSVLQTPLDVLVERGPLPGLVAEVAGQAAWVLVILLSCRWVQRRAERRLVVQGG